jgi:hypothetical protein
MYENRHAEQLREFALQIPGFICGKGEAKMSAERCTANLYNTRNHMLFAFVKLKHFGAYAITLELTVGLSSLTEWPEQCCSHGDDTILSLLYLVNHSIYTT